MNKESTFGWMGVSLPKPYIERLRREREEIGIPISTRIRKMLESNWQTEEMVNQK